MAKYLFVCKGNTRRSAIAQALLSARGGISDTAGTDVVGHGFDLILRGIPDDQPIYEAGASLGRSVEPVCTELGISPPSGHASKAVTQELIDWSDKVYYFNAGNLSKLESKFGANAKFTALDATSDIPDWDTYDLTVGETEDEFAILKEEGKHIKRCVDKISV
jgi:protein-tyrosine-phosphatase